MPSITEQMSHRHTAGAEVGLQIKTWVNNLENSISSLPIEILCQIVSYVDSIPFSQRDLWAMALVSRSWYSSSIASLYRKPDISGKNLGLFVRTLCPSINAHIRRTSFSGMVKELDMSKLVHDSSKSLTSRILGRLKDGLEVFVAPQASFA